MTNYVVKDCCKHQYNKKKKDKTKDLIVINNNIELETATVTDADLIDNNETMKVLKELTKIIKISKISAYLLFTKTNYIKIINHVSISDMVHKNFVSVFKLDTLIDKLVDNNYLETFLLLKHVLIDTSTSKSIIKHCFIPNNIYKTKKKVSNTYQKISGSNF